MTNTSQYQCTVESVRRTVVTITHVRGEVGLIDIYIIYFEHSVNHDGCLRPKVMWDRLVVVFYCQVNHGGYVK